MSKFASSALKGMVSVFLCFASVACAFVCDAAFSSGDGIVISMLAAIVFAFASICFGVKAIYCSLRERFSERERGVRCGIASDGRVERHEEAGFALPAMKGLASFSLCLAALGCTFVCDAMLSSRDGIAISMLAAFVFAFASICFGVKAAYRFLRNRISPKKSVAGTSLEKSVEGFEEKPLGPISAFVEEHERAIVKTTILGASIFAVFYFFFFVVGVEFSFFVALCFFLPLCAGFGYGLYVGDDINIFSDVRWLKNRPILRVCLSLAFFFTVITLAIIFGIVFSLMWLMWLVLLFFFVYFIVSIL